MEVQKHGFRWEKEMLHIFGATEEEIKSIPYTCHVDLPAKYNRLGRYPLSIKTSSSKGTICMADAIRLYDAVSSRNRLHLILIRYKQKANKKIVSSIIEFDLTDSVKELFGELTRSQLKHLDDTVKKVPQNRKPTVEEHATMYSIKKELQLKSGAISLAIKCNSTQSRLQCAIPYKKYEALIQNTERVIASSQTHEFRGGYISEEIESSKRVFKCKD